MPADIQAGVAGSQAGLRIPARASARVISVTLARVLNEEYSNSKNNDNSSEDNDCGGGDTNASNNDNDSSYDAEVIANNSNNDDNIITNIVTSYTINNSAFPH